MLPVLIGLLLIGALLACPLTEGPALPDSMPTVCIHVCCRCSLVVACLLPPQLWGLRLFSSQSARRGALTPSALAPANACCVHTRRQPGTRCCSSRLTTRVCFLAGRGCGGAGSSCRCRCGPARGGAACEGWDRPHARRGEAAAQRRSRGRRWGALCSLTARHRPLSAPKASLHLRPPRSSKMQGPEHFPLISRLIHAHAGRR